MDILEKLLKTSPLKIDNNVNLSGLGCKMDGFVATDIRSSVDKAIHLGVSEAGMCDVCNTFTFILLN